jgi:hypothetical protein
MKFDRRAFLERLGGSAGIALMSEEARLQSTSGSARKSLFKSLSGGNRFRRWPGSRTHWGWCASHECLLGLALQQLRQIGERHGLMVQPAL